MKKNRSAILIALSALLLASLACNAVTGPKPKEYYTTPTVEVAPDGPYIMNAHMSLDADDTVPTEVYKYTAPTFYCFFDLNDAPEGTVVKGTWVLLSAEGYQSQQVLDTAEITGTDGTYYFSLDNQKDTWPVGYYEIRLSVNGTLVESPGFQVK
jgi:hypothetical protein